MEVLTLVQTGKCDPMPIVMLETPGSHYWTDWKRYVVKHLLKRGKVSPEDMNLFKVTDSVGEAVKEIARFYRNFHSLRYVKDQLVVRLQKPPSEKLLGLLEEDFKDICREGAVFRATGALPEEKDHLDLPRLSFAFNRFNFGRLRQLINVLNTD